VHALPSLQLVPFVATGFEQAPLVGSHVPATWHWSIAAQTTGFDPVQAPLWQVYVCSHAFVPVHAAPSVTVGLEHAPVLGSHVPGTWHWSSAVQVTGLDPMHVPLSHVSVCVHASPSLQVVPFAAVGLEQTPVVGSQVPATWH
jgi:hypothetical protein